MWQGARVDPDPSELTSGHITKVSNLSAANADPTQVSRPSARHAASDVCGKFELEGK
jgi:hypothetical protein